MCQVTPKGEIVDNNLDKAYKIMHKACLKVFELSGLVITCIPLITKHKGGFTVLFNCDEDENVSVSEKDDSQK